MQPTLLMQFGPLLAATIALAGVALTLFITGRREHARNLMQREDDYRREQRTAVAAVAVAAHEYQQAGGLLCAPSGWQAESHDRHKERWEAAEAASTQLLNALTVARLIVHGPALQRSIDDLFTQWQATHGLLQEMVSLSWEGGAPAGNREAAWVWFNAAASNLQSVALDELRPTVVAAT